MPVGGLDPRPVLLGPSVGRVHPVRQYRGAVAVGDALGVRVDGAPLQMPFGVLAGHVELDGLLGALRPAGPVVEEAEALLDAAVPPYVRRQVREQAEGGDLRDVEALGQQQEHLGRVGHGGLARRLAAVLGAGHHEHPYTLPGQDGGEQAAGHGATEHGDVVPLPEIRGRSRAVAGGGGSVDLHGFNSPRFTPWTRVGAGPTGAGADRVIRRCACRAASPSRPPARCPSSSA